MSTTVWAYSIELWLYTALFGYEPVLYTVVVLYTAVWVYSGGMITSCFMYSAWFMYSCAPIQCWSGIQVLHRASIV